MPLAEHSLVTVEDLAQAFGLQSTEDLNLVAALNEAADRLERETGRRLLSTGYTNVRLDPVDGCRLWALEWPITAVASLTVDGTAQTVWLSEADGDPDDFQVRLRGDPNPNDPQARRYLERAGGWWSGPLGIKVSYTAGHTRANAPAELKEAAILLALDTFVRRDRRRLEEVSVSLNGQATTYESNRLYGLAVARLWPHRRFAF